MTKETKKIRAGNPRVSGRLCTVYLLIEVACFVKK
jgi:hypothetical protein